MIRPNGIYETKYPVPAVSLPLNLRAIKTTMSLLRPFCDVACNTGG